MNPSVFSRELKSNAAYTLIWTGGFLLSILPTVLSVVLPLRSAGKEYDIVAALAGTYSNLVNMTPIYAMILGSLVISKEQDEKTIEFLLAHPVTRGEIAVSKLLAYTVSVLFASLVLLAASLVLVAALGPARGHGVATILSLSLDIFVLMYAFGAAGMLISMFITKGGAVVGYSIGLPLLFAILQLLQSTGNRVLVALSYLSPFRYLDFAGIMETGRLDVPFVAIGAAIAAALLVASVATYRGKEFAA